MNIAFVNSTHKWGGVKTWILDFAGELRARHGVSVWGRAGAFLDAARERGLPAHAVSFGPDFNPLSVARFAAGFARRGVDVVFTNVGKDLTTAGVAARLLGIPVVQQIGLPADITPTARMRRLHGWIDPWFLCSCKYIRDGFLDWLPYVDRARTMTVLTAKRCAPEVTAPGRPLRLVMTSQLNDDKGHDLILRAIAGLRGAFRFRVVGTGRDVGKLKALARELGLQDKVEWCGFTTNVRAFLRDADVFILASSCEGLPNTLQEAMAEGLVPVCRDVGGCAEVWPDGMSDLLIPFEAGPEVYRAALQRLLDADSDVLQRLKAISRGSCVDNFALPTKAAELEDWLQSTVLRPRR